MGREALSCREGSVISVSRVRGYTATSPCDVTTAKQDDPCSLRLNGLESTAYTILL